MSKTTFFIVRAVGEITLYVLASPWLLLRWVMERRAAWRSLDAVRRGTIACPVCETENPLARLAKCQVCGAVTAGALVFCRFCKTTFPTISCVSCSATIEVLNNRKERKS